MNEDLKLKILHIFFPNKCACCKRIIKYDQLVCKECERDFEKPQGKRCKTCFSLEEKCDCKRFPKFFFRSVSPFLYKNSAKAALLSLKRIKNKRLARFFAEEMYLTVIKKYKDVKQNLLQTVTKKDFLEMKNILKKVEKNPLDDYMME